MFASKDKRKIYWLIDLYVSNTIDAETFANKYHEWYGLEIDLDTITPEEERIFNELADVAGRFTPFPTDIEHYPGTYFTEEELKKKAQETKRVLNKEFLYYLK